MKKIIVAFMLMVASSVFAAQQTVDVSKLTKEQQDQINMKVAEFSSPTNMSATVRKEAEAWGDLGANMGKAMVGAAKEVGVAADEFSKTSLGQITVAIIAYKIIGQDILGVIFGTFILITGFLFVAWLGLTEKFNIVTYKHEPVLWGLFTWAKVVERTVPNDTIIGKFVGGFLIICLTLLIGLNCIF